MGFPIMGSLPQEEHQSRSRTLKSNFLFSNAEQRQVEEILQLNGLRDYEGSLAMKARVNKQVIWVFICLGRHDTTYQYWLPQKFLPTA